MTDLYTNGAAHQTSAMKLLMSGMSGSYELRFLDQAKRFKPSSDACVIWGTRELINMRTLYDTVYVLERGYFNDRTKYYSLGINGLNGRADFRNNNSSSDRRKLHGPNLKRWRSEGNYYVIMGQVPGDMSLSNVDICEWYTQVYDELLTLGSAPPVYFRAHPLSLGNPTCIPTIDGPLETCLREAAGVVTFNSNTGVDAALAGVPIMCADRGAMAWDVAAHSLEQLLDFHYPDRVQWAYNLAYTQWTADELSNGSAWRHICL